MKKCPFCKADIEDNASFCLYCMKSLEEKERVSVDSGKNKQGVLLLIVVSLLIVAAGLFAFLSSCFDNGKDTSVSTRDEVASVMTSENKTSESTQETTRPTESKAGNKNNPVVNNRVESNNSPSVEAPREERPKQEASYVPEEITTVPWVEDTSAYQGTEYYYNTYPSGWYWDAEASSFYYGY